MKVAISDFGMSCRTNDAKTIKKVCGTPGFLDPNVLKGNNNTTKADIFGLGCLLY